MGSVESGDPRSTGDGGGVTFLVGVAAGAHTAAWGRSCVGALRSGNGAGTGSPLSGRVCRVEGTREGAMCLTGGVARDHTGADTCNLAKGRRRGGNRGRVVGTSALDVLLSL